MMSLCSDRRVLDSRRGRGGKTGSYHEVTREKKFNWASHSVLSSNVSRILQMGSGHSGDALKSIRWEQQNSSSMFATT